MHRLPILRQARSRTAAHKNRSMDHSRPAVGLSQGVDAFPAQPKYRLDYAKWYAALSGHNDGRSGDRAVDGDADDIPSLDPRDSFISEAEAA